MAGEAPRCGPPEDNRSPMGAFGRWTRSGPNARNSANLSASVVCLGKGRRKLTCKRDSGNAQTSTCQATVLNK
eukprot:6774793-Pyramimonas_sp.AAC.1